ncbi:hypothetical protein V8C86DRAFT_2457535 [Haematococcus lacustris]
MDTWNSSVGILLAAVQPSPFLYVLLRWVIADLFPSGCLASQSLRLLRLCSAQGRHCDKPGSGAVRWQITHRFSALSLANRNARQLRQ